MATTTDIPLLKHKREVIDHAIIRFAGDSGDGMQITGSQFTNTVALYGNDIATFPDYPAEIRAPAGTLPGVSGYQLHFSSNEVYTPGDAVDVQGVRAPLPIVQPHEHVRSSSSVSRTREVVGLQRHRVHDGRGVRLRLLPAGRLLQERLHGDLHVLCGHGNRGDLLARPGRHGAHAGLPVHGRRRDQLRTLIDDVKRRNARSRPRRFRAPSGGSG